MLFPTSQTKKLCGFEQDLVEINANEFKLPGKTIDKDLSWNKKNTHKQCDKELLRPSQRSAQNLNRYTIIRTQAAPLHEIHLAVVRGITH